MSVTLPSPQNARLSQFLSRDHLELHIHIHRAIPSRQSLSSFPSVCTIHRGATQRLAVFPKSKPKPRSVASLTKGRISKSS